MIASVRPQTDAAASGSHLSGGRARGGTNTPDMTAFAQACRVPFSNGTEGEAWMDKWCRYCARDHLMHDGDGPGCDLVLASMCDEWPEGWIPEPDDGHFHLPSRMVCMAFTPCEPCGGDPGAGDRAERVTEVTAYWRDRVTP